VFVARVPTPVQGSHSPADFVQTRRWTQLINPEDSPKQGKRNDDDCGVFASIAASYARADRPFDYDQRQVTSFFRAMMAHECFTLRLRAL
jgi:Ulp1 family protease